MKPQTMLALGALVLVGGFTAAEVAFLPRHALERGDMLVVPIAPGQSFTLVQDDPDKQATVATKYFLPR